MWMAYLIGEECSLQKFSETGQYLQLELIKMPE